MFLDKKYNIWLFVAVLLACFTVSAGVRFQQFETWKQTPQSYFVGERPMMTTLDAPYWLRLAREYNEGVHLQMDGLRVYPDGTDAFRELLVKELSIPLSYVDPTLVSSSSSRTQKINYRDVPLLSFLIANLTPFFNYNYYLTGTLLIPVLANRWYLEICTYLLPLKQIDLSALSGKRCLTYLHPLYQALFF